MIQKLFKTLLVLSLTMSLHMEAKKKHKKICSLLVKKCLQVCGNAVINGNLTVNGLLSGNVALGAYGYFYDTDDQSVPSGGALSFTNNGPLKGFTFTPPSSSITVNAPGIYAAIYEISGNGSQLFALALDGNLIAGSTYILQGESSGFVMFAASAGQVITLRNANVAPLETTGIEDSVRNSLLLIKIA